MVSHMLQSQKAGGNLSAMQVLLLLNICWRICADELTWTAMSPRQQLAAPFNATACPANCTYTVTPCYKLEYPESLRRQGSGCCDVADLRNIVRSSIVV